MCNKKERKETGGGICFQFPPSGRCILLFMAGRGGLFVFSRRDGAGFFLSEAGRGGFFFFSTGRDGTGRDGTGRDGTGRGGVFLFFSRAGTVVFGGGNFFDGTGKNSYTVPPKAV